RPNGRRPENSTTSRQTGCCRSARQTRSEKRHFCASSHRNLRQARDVSGRGIHSRSAPMAREPEKSGQESEASKSKSESAGGRAGAVGDTSSSSKAAASKVGKGA